MKAIESSDTVKFPDGVTFTVRNRIVRVKGPRGVLVRDFRHLAMELERVGKNSVRVRKWFGVRKEVAAVSCPSAFSILEWVMWTRSYRFTRCARISRT
jgi:large subunit ribosomal protein L9e